MTWGDIKPWISKLAPMLGGALGGPLGGAAGALLGSALGIKDATPENIQAAFTTGSLTGDQLVALKKAEQDFQAQMAQMEINSVKDLEALAVDDRKDARAMAVANKDFMPMVLGCVFTTGFFFILGWMLKYGLKKDGGDALLILLGALGAGVTQVLNFYFGSSSSSSRKDQLLYNSTPTETK